MSEFNLQFGSFNPCPDHSSHPLCARIDAVHDAWVELARIFNFDSSRSSLARQLNEAGFSALHVNLQIQLSDIRTSQFFGHFPIADKFVVGRSLIIKVKHSAEASCRSASAVPRLCHGLDPTGLVPCTNALSSNVGASHFCDSHAEQATRCLYSCNTDMNGTLIACDEALDLHCRSQTTNGPFCKLHSAWHERHISDAENVVQDLYEDVATRGAMLDRFFETNVFLLPVLAATHDLEQVDRCAICLEDMRSREDEDGPELAMLAVCKHVFCKRCIEWELLSRGSGLRRCPLCRARVRLADDLESAELATFDFDEDEDSEEPGT